MTPVIVISIYLVIIAVIGGLAFATLATLLVLPAVFALIQGPAHRRSASLHPDDLPAESVSA